jgi:hypothetical protein
MLVLKALMNFDFKFMRRLHWAIPDPNEIDLYLLNSTETSSNIVINI